MAPPQDYIALARKYGGVPVDPASPELGPSRANVDYVAMAKKYGGVPDFEETLRQQAAPTFDYLALARKHGGEAVEPVETPAPADVPAAPTPDVTPPVAGAGTRFLSTPLAGLTQGMLSLIRTPELLAETISTLTGRIIPPQAMIPYPLARTRAAMAPYEQELTAIKQANPWLEEGYQAVNNAPDIMGKIKAAIKHPDVISDTFLQSLPGMAAGVVTGIGWARALPALAAKAPWIVGGMGEATITYLQNLDGVITENKGKPLTAKQVALMAGSALLTGAIGAGSARFAKWAGFGDMDTMFIQAQRNSALRLPVALGIAAGVLQEANEEVWQTAQETIAQNVATDKPWFQGVSTAAVLGGIVGGLAGGGTNVAAAGRQAVANQRQAKDDERLQARIAPILAALEAAQAQPVAETPARTVAGGAQLDQRRLLSAIHPVAKALEADLEARRKTDELRPRVVRPEWSREQDVQASIDTAVANGEVVESELLVPSNLALRKMAKSIQKGGQILPSSVALLPEGTVILQHDPTTDTLALYRIMAKAKDGPAGGVSILASDDVGNILELADKGRAGDDLAPFLMSVFAGRTQVFLPKFPGQSVPVAPPAAPAAPGTPTPETGPMAAPVTEVAPAAQPVPAAAPVAAPAAELTDAELLKQMEAVMTGQAPPPVAAAPATPAPAPTPAAPSGVPFVMTRKMESQLKKLGYTPEQINAMAPAEAQTILAAEAAKNPPPPPPPAPTQAPAAATPVAAPALDPLVAALSQAAQGLMDAANAIGGKPANAVPASPETGATIPTLAVAPNTAPIPAPAAPAPVPAPTQTGGLGIEFGATGNKGIIPGPGDDITTLYRGGTATGRGRFFTTDLEAAIAYAMDMGDSGRVVSIDVRTSDLPKYRGHDTRMPGYSKEFDEYQVPSNLAATAKEYPLEDLVVDDPNIQKWINSRKKSPAPPAATPPAATPPAEPVAPEPDVPPAAEAEAPRERTPTELPANLYRQVEATTIKFDPKVYQFKASDAKGETGRLRHVTKWDQVSGAVTPVLLHERANGDLYVADGHQRVALAQRLIAAGESVPKLNAIVLREADGFDAAEVRRAAALANVRQNSATPVDIAKLLREAPLSPEEEATIPRGNIEGERFRQAQGLAKLGDAAFSAVVNGELEPAYAQFVGEILTDPAQQIAAIRALVAAELPNAYQAERFVKELRNEGFVTETQTDLFGEQAVADALIKEKAQVLDAVRKVLGSQKSAFANAFRHRVELEAAGNVLNVGSNERLAALAARQKLLLEAFADKAGSQTQQAIREAARRVHAKEISAKDAAPDVIRALERDFKNGPPEGSAPLGPGPSRPAPTQSPVGQPPPQVTPTNPAKKPTDSKTTRVYNGSAEIARRGGLTGDLRLDIASTGKPRVVGDTIDSMGTWWTSSAADAAHYARYYGEDGKTLLPGAVVETELLLTNPRIFASPDEFDKFLRTFRVKQDGVSKPPSGSSVRASLEQHGYDGLIVRGGGRGDATPETGDFYLSFGNKGVKTVAPTNPAKKPTAAKQAAKAAAAPPAETTTETETFTLADIENLGRNHPVHTAILETAKDSDLSGLTDALQSADVIDADQVVTRVTFAPRNELDATEYPAPWQIRVTVTRPSTASPEEAGPIALLTENDIHNWDATNIQAQWKGVFNRVQREKIQEAFTRHHQKGTSAKDELAKLREYFGETASPEEAKAILASAGEQLKKQPQFDMPPLTLTGEQGPPAEQQASIFDASPQSQEQIDALRKEREELYKKLGKELDTLTMGPYNPEVAKLAVQLMRNYAKEGYIRFSDVVGRLVHDIGSAKVQVLADYLNTAWNIVHKEKVDTLETLKTATPMPPKTAPTTTPVVDQTPVEVVRGKIQGLSAVDQKVLDDHGLTVQVGSGGSILLTGRTYDLQPKLKELGGQLTAIGKTHVWELDPTGFRGVLTHVSGLPLPKGRPALPRAYWTVDSRLSQLRKDAEGRDDNSGLVGDPRGNLLPHIVRLIDEGGRKRRIPQFILDEQIEDAYRIASTYNANDANRKMFMLASDPGSGKTFVLGAAIAQMKDYGAESITYVTQNQALIRQIKRDLKQLDLEDVNFLSYDQLRESDPHPTDVFILDESHKAKNIVGNIPTAVKAQEWMKLANFTVFSSATPYEDPTQMRYLTSTDIFKREFADFESFAFAFGATPRVKPKKGGKTEDIKLDPVWAPTRTSDADAAAARAWLAKTGMFASRRIRLPEGQVDSRLVKVTVPDHESLIYDAVVTAAATVEARQKLEGIEHAWMVNFQKRLLEASKVTQAITEAKAALDRKRFPVVFVETKAERNYNIPEIIEKDRDYEEMAQQYRAQKLSPPPRSTWSRGKDDKTPLPPAGIVAMLAQFMADQGEPNIVIPPVEEVFMTHFGRDKVAVYTGSIGDTRAEQNLEDWRKGVKPILVVTMAKGGTGLSLHDTEGDHPTTQININLPWTGTNVLQVSQRTARYGLATNAEIEWLFADNILMDRILASRVGTRMSSLGATVHGLPSVQAGQVQEWNLDGAPFSEIARLNKLMSDQEVAALEEPETPDGELAYMTEEGEEETGEETGEESPYMSAPRGPGVPPPHLFGLPGKAPTGEPLKALPLPEAVELADLLMGEGHIRIVKHFRKKGQLSSFNADPAKYGIKLHAGLFTKARAQELASALLHEIGHLTDWMPDKFIKRGNLLGRILSVTSMFRDHHFTRPDGTTVALADVKDELIQLSAQWRPWNRASSPPSFIKYRDSAVELYADALSALYNSPGLVQRVAPTFYAEFFTYLNRKPEVAAAYFDLQARLDGDPANVLAHYQAGMETMLDVGNTMSVDLQKQRLAAAEKMRGNKWMHLRSDFVDLDVPIQDMVRADSKAGIYVSPAQNPTFASEERRQVPGRQKRLAEKYFAPIDVGLQQLGISRSQFGTVLIYERIALGDRGEVANPKGTDIQRSLDAYAALQRTWGPEKTREVRHLLDLFRTAVDEVTTDAYERGELYTQAQWEKMGENPAYATYRRLDYLAESVTAELYHQIGTFGAIQNPLDATIAKMLVTIRATQDNYTRILLDNYLNEPQHRDAIEVAERYFAGPTIGWRFKPPTAQAKLRGHTELAMVKHKGKWEGRYVDPWIARSWNAWTVDRRNAILDVLRLVNGKFFRPLFITYNVGFQAYNLFRDFYRYWKNIPGMTLGRAFKRYYQALDIAKVRAFGLPENPTARQKAAQEFLWEAEQASLLGITYNELHDEHTLSDEHIENLLAAAHVPGYGKQPISHPVLRPLMAVLNTIKATGDLIETLPKAAGIIEFMGDGSIADIPPDQRSFIRRKVGSPDFTTTSFYKAITNEVFLFSNAIIQAVRSDFEVMTDPTTRTGYWMKTVAVNLVPKLLMAAATAGLLGEALRRMLAASSEYDKTNYVVIPIHEDADGNVTSIKLPQDDMGRLLGGMLWKGLGMARGRTDAIQTLQQLADYTGGQLPNVSPIFNLVGSTATYATGGNPRDAFRGRNVLTDQEQVARGWPAFKKFTGWEFQQLGGGILYKFYNNEPFPKEKTWGQRLVNLPLTGNITGRFVTVGQYGRAEEARAAARQPAQLEARMSLRERDAAYRVFTTQRPPSTPEAAKAMADRLARQLYPGDRATQADRADNIKRRLQMGAKRGEADAFGDAVLNAPTITAKVAVLQDIRRQKGAAAFPTWLRRAREAGIVSDAAYKAYMAGRVSTR
jgi:hypothetical protein